MMDFFYVWGSFEKHGLGVWTAGVWTAAYNPDIFLTEPLAFKAYTATNIFEIWIYEHIYIYTDVCFIKMFVCQAVLVC